MQPLNKGILNSWNVVDFGQGKPHITGEQDWYEASLFDGIQFFAEIKVKYTPDDLLKREKWKLLLTITIKDVQYTFCNNKN